MSDTPQNDNPQEVTRLLARWGQGDRNALEDLTPLVYNELRRLAKAYLRRERPDHTLEGTALVHEAYLRLVDQRAGMEWRTFCTLRDSGEGRAGADCSCARRTYAA